MISKAALKKMIEDFRQYKTSQCFISTLVYDGLLCKLCVERSVTTCWGFGIDHNLYGVLK